MVRLLIVALLSVTLHSFSLPAQSAVYFCKQNGTYGFCYNGATEMSARECAYNQCIEAGGNQPTKVASTDAKGFGAICVGTDNAGNTVIGVAMGFETQEEADKASRKQCRSMGAGTYKIDQRWEDR